MVTTQPGPWHRTMAAITTPAHATAPRNAQNHNRVVPDDRDDSEPAKRRWRIQRIGIGWWHVTSPNCRGRDEDDCRWATTHTAAITYVTTQLRNHALTAIENQEATNQPQEDQ